MSNEQYKMNSQRIFEDIWNTGNLAITQDLFAPRFMLHVPLGTFQVELTRFWGSSAKIVLNNSDD